MSARFKAFFPARVGMDNLSAGPLGALYFQHKDLVRPVVVSPDAGGVTRAKDFRNALVGQGKQHPEVGLAMIIKQRKEAGKIGSMDIVGSVGGCDAIICDDMIDTAGTLCAAAKLLKENGARRVFAYATHGLFSGPAAERLEESVLEEVVVTNSVPLPKVAR